MFETSITADFEKFMLESAFLVGLAGLGFLIVVLSPVERAVRKRYAMLAPWVPLGLFYLFIFIISWWVWLGLTTVLPLPMGFATLGGRFARCWVVRQRQRKRRTKRQGFCNRMEMPSTKKTLVLGASDNPRRYSFLAVKQLRGHGHPVAAIGRKPATVGDVDIVAERSPVSEVDTVTLYLSAAHQKEYYEYILSLHPKRIIFNPGAENPELEALATANGIQPVEACTLVMLSTGQY